MKIEFLLLRLCQGSHPEMPYVARGGASSPEMMIGGATPCGVADVVRDLSAIPSAEQSSSSSIGEDSDRSGGGGDGGSRDAGEEEVQSALAHGPLDLLGSMEESLPMRRGFSQYYSGKSKSFTSLAEAANFSAKALAKPENPYSRKRKNLLAHKTLWGKPHCCPNPYMNNSGGSLSKKPTGLSRRSQYFSSANLAESLLDSISSSSSSSSSFEELDQMSSFST